MSEQARGPCAETIILLVMFAFGFTAGVPWGSSGERDKAVKAGVGRYAVDPATGAAKFVYGAKEGGTR